MSREGAIVSISSKIGCAPQMLNEWVKKAEVDRGDRTGITTEMAEKMKALERENRELRQANEILRKASAYFAPTLGDCLAITCRAAGRSSTAGPGHDRLYRREQGYRGRADLQVPADCSFHVSHDHMAKRANPDLLSDRAKRDKTLQPEIARVWEQNYKVYGVRKVWHQMRREGFDVARCTVARLMNDMGLDGVIRGKKARTTLPDKALPCPLDKVNRQFKAPAPDILWGRPWLRHWSERPMDDDFTYVATTARQHMLACVRGGQGFVYVAFVIDAFARRIVGWRVSRTAHAGCVLDALEQAVHQRQPGSGLVHHSDRGSQYLSIKYSERLAEAGIEPSVGSVGDSDDNALAETIIGLFKAEVIHRRGPWRNFEAVEYATLEWVDWFNNRRRLEPIGHIPPAQAEANFYVALERSDMAA